jgi:two-component system OmpR family response regulator
MITSPNLLALGNYSLDVARFSGEQNYTLLLPLNAAQKSGLNICKWRIDTGSYELFTPEGDIQHLTTAEFELLKTFLEHPQKVLSRDFLRDHIHGKDWNIFDHGIDNLTSGLE